MLVRTRLTAASGGTGESLLFAVAGGGGVHRESFGVGILAKSIKCSSYSPSAADTSRTLLISFGPYHFGGLLLTCSCQCLSPPPKNLPLAWQTRSTWQCSLDDCQEVGVSIPQLPCPGITSRGWELSQTSLCRWLSHPCPTSPSWNLCPTLLPSMLLTQKALTLGRFWRSSDWDTLTRHFRFQNSRRPNILTCTQSCARK